MTTDRPVAVVTGGSRGLGFALASSLIGDGWRGGDRRSRSAGARRSRSVVAGRSGRRGMRRREGCGGHLRRRRRSGASRSAACRGIGARSGGPAREQRQRARPFASPAARRLPARRAHRRVRRQRRRTARPDPGDAGRPASHRRNDHQRHLRCRRRGVPRLGWLRLVEGALEQLSRVLAAEEPEVRVYWFDPGDMRTAMHQEAFPGEDIADRPEPTSVVPALRRLLREAPPSGRYRAADWQEATS